MESMRRQWLHTQSHSFCLEILEKKRPIFYPLFCIFSHPCFASKAKEQCWFKEEKRRSVYIGVPGNRRNRTMETQPKHVGEGRPARDSRPLKANQAPAGP